MKQNISKNDLNELTPRQRQTLRESWMPEKNDFAVAYICTDAENETYNEIEFVVGDIIIEEINEDKRSQVHKSPIQIFDYHNIILKRLRLLDEEFYEENRSLFESEEAAELEFAFPDDYFYKDDCLPLFTIGQLIEIIRTQKFGNFGYSIEVAKAKSSRVDENEFTVVNEYKDMYEGTEICDVLWGILKLSL